MEFGNILMTIPTFKKGDKLWAADLQTLADAVRANRVLPGAGIRITGGPNGTTVAANIPRGAKSGTMTLHQVDFEDLIPDPFKIMQEVITLTVFVPFAVLYMKEPLRLNYLYAAFCLMGAVYFIFVRR